MTKKPLQIFLATLLLAGVQSTALAEQPRFNAQSIDHTLQADLKVNDPVLQLFRAMPPRPDELLRSIQHKGNPTAGLPTGFVERLRFEAVLKKLLQGGLSASEDPLVIPNTPASGTHAHPAQK